MIFALAAIFPILVFPKTPFSVKDPFNDLKVPSFQRLSSDLSSPTKFWSQQLLDGRSLPTNSWWMNFVLPNGEENNNNVFVFPQVIIARSLGLAITDPHLSTSGVQAQSLFDTVVEPVIVGSPQINEPHVVSQFDALSATLSWGGNKMQAPVLRGMGFSTMIYNGVSASVTTSQIAKSIKFDGAVQDCSSNSTVTATEVEVAFIQSDATYLIFFDGPTALACFANTASFAVNTLSSYSGAVRVALSNNCTYGFNSYHCPQENLSRQSGVDQSVYTSLLRENFATYAVGGSVDYAVDESQDTATVTFQYETRSMTNVKSKGDFLSFTLPHHRDSLTSATALPFGFHRTIRGLAKPVLGASLTFTEKLTPLQFESTNQVDEAKKSAIISSLVDESTYDLPLNYALGAGDTYFSGKMIAKLARLVEIASELNQTALVSPMLATLKERLEIWVNASSAALMLYDATWGGYISCGCYFDDCGGLCTPTCNNERSGANCPAVRDPGMNFGNGVYNDHHFHYGYHLYGAAVATKLDHAWGAQHAESFLLYARDFMNPSVEDTAFVQWRMMDFFAGHSWAGGISLGGSVAYYNGRNQESTSESVHAYYAAALYGKTLRAVSGYEAAGVSLEQAGRVALALELRTTDKYWHVYQADYYDAAQTEPNVYESVYRHNGVVGILWSSLVQFQTWFGGEPYYVHGIQQVPYTPISEAMLPKAWVKEEYGMFAAGCTGACTTNGWQTFVVMEESILDKESAWAKALKLPASVFSNDDAGGNGNSRTNTLHFIATR